MRIAILADVHNLFCSAKQCFQAKIDYTKLREGVAGSRQLVRSIAYLTSRPESAQNGFIGALIRGGWETKVKEAKIHLDHGTGLKSIINHPPTVETTMDAMLLRQKVDCICLVTGDGTYTPLVSFLKQTGCHVEIFGFERLTSVDLQKAATAFVPIKQEWSFKDIKKEETSGGNYNPTIEETAEECDEKQPVVPNQPVARIAV